MDVVLGFLKIVDPFLKSAAMVARPKHCHEDELNVEAPFHVHGAETLNMST